MCFIVIAASSHSVQGREETLGVQAVTRAVCLCPLLDADAHSALRRSVSNHKYVLNSAFNLTIFGRKGKKKRNHTTI